MSLNEIVISQKDLYSNSSGVKEENFFIVGTSPNVHGGLRHFVNAREVFPSLGISDLAINVKNAIVSSGKGVYVISKRGSIKPKFGQVFFKGSPKTKGHIEVGLYEEDKSFFMDRTYKVLILKDASLDTARNITKKFKVSIFESEVFLMNFDVSEEKREIIIKDKNLKILFDNGSYFEGDSFSFDIFGERLSDLEIKNTLENTIETNTSKSFEFIAISGSCSKSVIEMINELLISLEERNKFYFAIFQARDKSSKETEQEYVENLLSSEKPSGFLKRVRVCASMVISEDGEVPGLGFLAGMILKRSSHQPIDATSYNSLNNLRGIYKITGVTENRSFSSDLEAGGYTVFRTYSDYLRNEVYVSSSKGINLEGSDYEELESLRLVDEACRAIVISLFGFLKNKNKVDSNGRLLSGNYLLERLNNALAFMEVEDEFGRPKVSSYKVSIDKNQNVLETGTLRVDLSLKPLNKIGKIEVNVGLEGFARS